MFKFKFILILILSLNITNIVTAQIDIVQNKSTFNSKGPYCTYACLDTIGRNLKVESLYGIYNYAAENKLEGYFQTTVMKELNRRGIKSEFTTKFNITASYQDLKQQNPIIISLNRKYNPNAVHAVLVTHIDQLNDIITIVDPNEPYEYKQYKNIQNFLDTYWYQQKLTLILRRR